MAHYGPAPGTGARIEAFKLGEPVASSNSLWVAYEGPHLIRRAEWVSIRVSDRGRRTLNTAAERRRNASAAWSFRTELALRARVPTCPSTYRVASPSSTSRCNLPLQPLPMNLILVLARRALRFDFPPTIFQLTLLHIERIPGRHAASEAWRKPSALRPRVQGSAAVEKNASSSFGKELPNPITPRPWPWRTRSSGSHSEFRSRTGRRQSPQGVRSCRETRRLRERQLRLPSLKVDA